MISKILTKKSIIGLALFLLVFGSGIFLYSLNHKEIVCETISMKKENAYMLSHGYKIHTLTKNELKDFLDNWNSGEKPEKQVFPNVVTYAYNRIQPDQLFLELYKDGCSIDSGGITIQNLKRLYLPEATNEE